MDRNKLVGISVMLLLEKATVFKAGLVENKLTSNKGILLLVMLLILVLAVLLLVRLFVCWIGCCCW